MDTEFPRCSVCRISIQPGMGVVFTPDGRVHHVQCPKVICPVCSCEILPSTPIRRDGEAMIHGSCWMRRYRQRAGVSAPPDNNRTEIVRARLASGAIPGLDPTKVCGGTSLSGDSICAGCAERILMGQIEYEVQFADTLVFRLHRACYLIWQEQRGSVRREIGGGSAASAWTLLFDDGVARHATRDPVAFEQLLIVSAETMFTVAATRHAAAVLREDSKRLRASAASS